MTKTFHLAILVVLSLLLYSNSYNCSWQFDDHENIVNNTKIHLTKFHAQALNDTIYSNGPDKMYRPVACFTFALNWYLGGLDVFGYHLVNISIHILNSIFLYLVIVKILSIKKHNGKNFKHKYEVALLASLLWAINPVNVQAVTYIVQRMASLATLFSIIAIYFYLEFKSKKKMISLFACLVSFLFGIFCKENAVMLPFSILLLEFVFFKKNFTKEIFKKIPIIITCCLIVFAIAILLFDINLLGILKYENRVFTPVQRILTESRILVFYLYQIFIPNLSNLSIHHDIFISQSIFDPISTFFSIIFILFLIGSSIAVIKKYPLLSFAILFYFLNHIVESSIIGLELLFEHRNYLPSFFLFLPCANLVVSLRDKFKIKSHVLFGTIHLVILILILCYGMTTYSRNFDWKTEKSLWEDAMEKAPESSRPPHNLAWSYYGRIGDITKAMELYKKALSLNFYDKLKKSIILGNIALIHYEKGDRNKALKYMGKAAQQNPRFIEMKTRLAFMLINYGEYESAEIILEKVIKENPNDIEAIYLLGKNFYLLEEYENAIHEFRKILDSEKQTDIVRYLSCIYLKLKLYDKSKLMLSTYGSNALEHKLLGILTAYFQEDSKKIDILLEDFFKKNTALFIKNLENNKSYIDINHDFNNVFNKIFQERLEMQVLKLKGLQ